MIVGRAGGQKAGKREFKDGRQEGWSDEGRKDEALNSCPSAFLPSCCAAVMDNGAMKIAFCLTAAAAAFTIVAGAAQSGGGRLLVLNKEDATFVIVNPDSGAVLAKVGVGQGPHEVIASTDGKYAFASNYGTGGAPGHTISMIDIAARKELR